MNWKAFAGLFAAVWTMAWVAVVIFGVAPVPEAPLAWNFVIVFVGITLVGLPLTFFVSVPVCSWTADVKQRRRPHAP